MTNEQQLQLWVHGISVHNAELEQCCPDFSCCDPSLLVDREIRERFVAASEDNQAQMLMMFLGAGLARFSEKKVYLAGDETNYQETS